MLKQLHDAAKRVLDLRAGDGHSLAEEIDAHEQLAAAVDAAGHELARKPKPAAKKKPAKKPSAKADGKRKA